MKKLIKKKPLLSSFLLSILLGIIITLPNIIIGKGIYSLSADLNYQEIPFAMITNYSLKTGQILWTWYNDLGSNFIPTYAFYGLLSPFNLISYLTSSSAFPYLLGPILILKYGICGITSYLFLKRYVKEKEYAVLGSLLYTFSGFQLTNILFYNFHDVVAHFPLLLYSLDNFIYDKKRGYLAPTILLCTLTNWFFLIGEGIFTAIYFFIKVIKKDYQLNKKMWISLIIEGVLGLGTAAFLLSPTLLFTITNPRIGSNWSIRDIIKYPYLNYFEIIRGLILPAETMSNRALASQANYTSTELYLPVVGLTLAIPYLLKKKKDPFSILFKISLIMMFVPILNSIFYLLTTNYYARWFYMPTLIMSLMSVKTLEENINPKKGILLTSLIFLALLILTTIYHIKYTFLINDPIYLVEMVSISLLGIIITYQSTKRSKYQLQTLLLAIFILVGIHGNYMVYKYKNDTWKSEEGLTSYLTYQEDLENFLQNERTNSSPSCRPNLGNTKRINNIRTFNSNINEGSFTFYKSVDYPRETSTEISIADKELNNVLAVKYIIACQNDTPEQYGYEYQKKIGTYRIYENKEYKKFGDSPKDFITKEEYETLPKEEKIKTLEERIVLDEEQTKKYENLYPNEASQTKNEFTYTKNGFKSTITTTNQTIAIYQIPYDEGFTATRNNKKVELENVDNGFIGIPLEKGENKIEVKYLPKGLKEGILISILSLAVYLIYLIRLIKLKN